MVYGQGRNPNQFNNMQQQDVAGFGAFGNFGNMPGTGGMVGSGGGVVGFTQGGSGGEYSGGGFGAGMNMGVNSAGMGQNTARPYGSNPVFPNQNQGQPRYW